jgi:phosphate transport system substrate-binding protein
MFLPTRSLARAPGALLLIAALAVALTLPGCGKRSSRVRLNGAGASFPYPVYARWTHRYHKLKGVRINYQSIGSGGGIAQIKAKTVDFGASDAPLSPGDLDAAGLIQFPMVMGGVVPVIHVPGLGAGQLRLTATLLADIFLGKIKRWNDPALARANPGLKLPAKDITVVHRADGSGTTWIFTNYLSKVSAAWKSKVGTGKAVAWPTGVGGKGNEGVAAYVTRLGGAIGYVEYAYALRNKIPHVLLQNRAGKLVAPTIETFQAAAANADWAKAPGFYMVLTHQGGDQSWPITGATFILMHKHQPDARKARAMLRFFDWCYRYGAETAKKLHYVPMPDAVIKLVQQRWREALRAAGKPVWR